MRLRFAVSVIERGSLGVIVRHPGETFPLGIANPQGLTRFVSRFAAVPPAVSATSLVSEYPGAAFTLRVADPVPLAPYAPPLQPSENVSAPAAVGVTVFDPVAARLPLQPPLAVQVVPALDDQVDHRGLPKRDRSGVNGHAHHGSGIHAGSAAVSASAAARQYQSAKNSRHAAKCSTLYMQDGFLEEKDWLLREVSAQRAEKGLI